MKVLTLHQPWASLVALGVKTIETRSWSTQFRGPLAIHAAASTEGLRSLEFDYEDGWAVGSLPGDDRFAFCWQRIANEMACQWYWHGAGPNPLPLGAIVATCTLVDVVPILAAGEDPSPGVDRWVPHVAETSNTGALWHWRGRSEHENLSTGRPTWVVSTIEDQRPYGDFTPGRYAWLLADVVPVDPPVLFKGGQGLTKTWEPAAA